MGTSDTALILQRLLAITDTGLSFAASEFDRERYADIRDNLNQLLSETAIWIKRNFLTCSDRQIFMRLLWSMSELLSFSRARFV